MAPTTKKPTNPRPPMAVVHRAADEDAVRASRVAIRSLSGCILAEHPQLAPPVKGQGASDEPGTDGGWGTPTGRESGRCPRAGTHRSNARLRAEVLGTTAPTPVAFIAVPWSPHGGIGRDGFG